jgi:hypothetical protein
MKEASKLGACHATHVGMTVAAVTLGDLARLNFDSFGHIKAT